MRINLTKKDLINAVYMQIGFSKSISENLLDDILKRSNLMFTMYLEPGDLQLINNHAILHSRTTFIDSAKHNQKRLLFRLWLAPPYSFPLPISWKDYFRNTNPGTVRGGIRGQKYNIICKQFEERQATAMGMLMPK